MSLSSHFKNSVSVDKSDLSWLSAASLTAVGLGDEKPETRETKTPIVPKDSLPSKGVSTYLKNVRFNAYKSTRPALLLEINSILGIGERKLQNEYGDKAPPQELLSLYAGAFDRFIEESTLYQPFLSKLKVLYDGSVEDCNSKLDSYQHFDQQLVDKEAEYANKLEESTLALKTQVEQLSAKLKAVKASEEALLENVKSLNHDNTRLVEMNNTLRKEADTSRSTAASLSSALARMAEEKLKFDVLESGRLQEISNSKQLEVSLNTELDRLHRIVAEKEAVHETLVSPDKLAVVTGELQLFKQENKRLSSAHRHLLIRYAALKFMIDGAFKRLDDMHEQAGSPSIERTIIQTKLQAIMKDYHAMKRSQQKKQEIRLKTPNEKIMRIVESTQYPKVAFEALLDQIEVLQMEKRRLLFGDNADLDQGEEGDEDAGMEELLIPGAVLDGLGLGEDVPVYLRYEGQVRNINIGRKTIVELAHEICTAKAAHEAAAQPLSSSPLATAAPSKKRGKSAGGGSRVNGGASVAGSTVAGGDSDSDLDSVSSRNSPSGRPGSTVGMHSPFPRPLSPELAGLAVHSHGLHLNAAEVYVPLLPSLPATASMAEFFGCFLKDKMTDDVAGIELAYNIVDALRRFGDHSDCQLFSALLAGQVPPAVWFDRVVLVEKLRSAVIKENATNTRSADGEWKLTPEKFMKVVKKVLNTRTDEEIAKLAELVASEQNPESRYVNATMLLWDGEEGERSPFLELVKTQHLEDCASMEKIVIACIEQVCEPGVVEVAISKLREALALSDANKARSEINQLLARGVGCTLEAVLLKEAKRVPVVVEEFKVNIKTGVLKKSPVPQPKKSKK